MSHDPEYLAYIAKYGVAPDWEAQRRARQDQELLEFEDHVISLVGGRSLDAATDQALASDAARDEEDELFSGVAEAQPAPPNPLGDALERQRAINAKLIHKDDDLPVEGGAISDWDMDGPELAEAMPAAVPASTSAIPASIAALINPGETLTEARRRLTEILNIELAELVLARGTNKENLEREAEIQHLRNLLARIGEA